MSSGLIHELWLFMKVRKKWWLLPVIAIMLACGLLVALTEGSVLAPFIYSIF